MTAGLARTSPGDTSLLAAHGGLDDQDRLADLPSPIRRHVRRGYYRIRLRQKAQAG